MVEPEKPKKASKPEKDAKPSPQDAPLPFSDLAERGILSCFLHNPTPLLNDAKNTIPREGFYHPCSRLLYEVLLDFIEDERPVEYLVLSQYLQDKGLLDKVGGQGHLAELLDFVPAPTHYSYYKGIVLDKLRLRQIIGACKDSITDAYEYQEDVAALHDIVTDRFIALSRQQQGQGRKSWKAVTEDYTDTWEARQRGERDTGIPTRWRSFNQTWGGITPTYWLITGYPSSGKSTLVQNMEEDALSHGKRVLKFSFEMDEVELADRYTTAKTQLNSARIFYPQNGIDSGEMRQINRALGEMRDWKLELRCDNFTFEQVMSECRSVAMQYSDLGLITIDYLQLMSCARTFKTRADEITHMSRGIKRLSKSLGMPVVVLSQLNDEGKTFEGRAPTQDASNIACIETARKEQTRPGKWTTYPAGVRVVKNRNGKKDHLLPLTLNGPTFTFVEESSEDPELPTGPGWD